MSPELRIAGVGAGYFSQFHYDSWNRMPRAEVVGVCDIDPARAAATGFPAFDDVARMIEKTRPDLLDVIVPPTTHAGVIRTALAAGIRHLICQKPFCRDLAEARAITAEAEVAGAMLVVHENFRFQPWYRATSRAMSDGLIGQAHQATFRLRPGDGQGPKAYLDRQPYFQTMERFLVRETAVHWIDTFRFLLGDPTGVYADLRRLNPAIAGEDAGHILFDHPNEVRALFDGNRHLDHAAENRRRTMGEALFEGTEGTLTLTGDGALHLRRFGEARVRTILPPDDRPEFGGDCVHALQCHVVEGILDGLALENEAADYLTVIAIEEAIYRSAAERRKILLEDSQ